MSQVPSECLYVDRGDMCIKLLSAACMHLRKVNSSYRNPSRSHLSHAASNAYRHLLVGRRHRGSSSVFRTSLLVGPVKWCMRGFQEVGVDTEVHPVRGMGTSGGAEVERQRESGKTGAFVAICNGVESIRVTPEID